MAYFHLLTVASGVSKACIRTLTICCHNACNIMCSWISISKSNTIKRRFTWVEIRSLIPVENAHICNKLQPHIKTCYVRKISRLLYPFCLFCYITQFSPNSIVPIQNFINWMCDKLTRFCGLPFSNFGVFKWTYMFIWSTRARLTCRTAFWTRITDILCYCSEWFPSKPSENNLHKVKN